MRRQSKNTGVEKLKGFGAKLPEKLLTTSLRLSQNSGDALLIILIYFDILGKGPSQAISSVTSGFGQRKSKQKSMYLFTRKKYLSSYLREMKEDVN